MPGLIGDRGLKANAINIFVWLLRIGSGRLSQLARTGLTLVWKQV